MTGLVTAAVVIAASTVYQVEEQRKAKSDADEAIKKEKMRIAEDERWGNVKKDANDRNASNFALRMRNSGEKLDTTSMNNAVEKDASLGVLGL